MFEWILTGLSILGTFFNIQKKVSGWVIWTVSNIGWIISFSLKGMVAETTLFSIYLVLSMYGIYKWMRPRQKRNLTPNNAEINL